MRTGLSRGAASCDRRRIVKYCRWPPPSREHDSQEVATQANSQHSDNIDHGLWRSSTVERCTESGVVMEEFEESEDDEDPNKPGPVEAYAFRACGKACGTCE